MFYTIFSKLIFNAFYISSIFARIIKSLVCMKSLIISILAVFVTLSAMSLNPKREYEVTPADYGMDFLKVTFEADDGVEIFGWFFKSPDPKSRKVVILSDDGEGNMADLIEIASNFISLGYNVLSYDYRGFGKSADFEIKKSFFIYSQFAKDLNAAIDWVRMEYPSLRNLDLYGQGIGAGLSLGVGASRDEVFNVIADSPYMTFELAQKRYLEIYGQRILMPLGYDKTVLEPLYALEETGRSLEGILIIRGENDELFTEDDMKELSKIQKKFTDTHTVSDADQNSTFITDKAAYFEVIREFVED
jgi:hypothetical protein